ncbi:MAG: polyprenyl synthetase family protein [Deltaproteobacteria bacterium]|nr:polyprenyl synthetase family protein [Deltaproteobacteria bacterium]MBW2218066.1 polyprenyl synthetase family protein [Deltaproteobacteria bacterium]
MKGLKEKIIGLADEDLLSIETALKKNLITYLDLVSDVAGHILFAGGKRFRPFLMVLSARICGYTGEYDKTFSVIFEYLHTATLLHDDLVDDATIRRGKAAANTVYGNAEAVLVGDFLLARSLSIAVRTGKIEVIEAIGEITEDMSQGEIHQLIGKGNLNLTEEEYMDVIRRKTAALIMGACKCGALIAEAGKEKASILSTYGYNLGMAFQMTDDLLDYTSDTGTLGKAVGADLKEGKLTLPVIHSLKNAGPADRKKMEAVIKNSEFSIDEFDILKGMLEKYGGISYTESLAADHVAKAKEALSAFKPTETRDLMMMLADYSVNRES